MKKPVMGIKERYFKFCANKRSSLQGYIAALRMYAAQIPAKLYAGAGWMAF